MIQSWCEKMRKKNKKNLSLGVGISEWTIGAGSIGDPQGNKNGKTMSKSVISLRAPILYEYLKLTLVCML